jgi:hypothetical protein
VKAPSGNANIDMTVFHEKPKDKPKPRPKITKELIIAAKRSSAILDSNIRNHLKIIE